MSDLSKNFNPTSKIIVQKYGGATLADPEKIKAVAERIFKLNQSGDKLVVIVSAMGQTTNQLIELAQKVSTRPPLREMDMLLSVGERISMTLLSMALNDLGCPAISFTGSQAGIMTDDSHISANIIEIKAFRVEQALKENKVVILAGFQGVSAQTKEITTLGRGGSDISAVAMAAYLKADRCEILKDVDGVYTADPKLVSNAKGIPELNYSQLLDMTEWGAKVLNQRSVQWASDNNVTLYVGPASENLSNGTLISHNKKFDIQKPIAINSFSKIFELKINSSDLNFENFQSFLQQNQIGQVQWLRQQNGFEYFTAPQEILNAIKDFINNHSIFEITNKSLSSVSVTFSNLCRDAELKSVTDLLKKNNIPSLIQFADKQSAHFILSSDLRISTINLLHNLCLA